MSLIWDFLRAGIMEQGNYRHSLLGTPQGGIVSPLLANIYLHELDRYMERYTELSNWERRKRKRHGTGKLPLCTLCGRLGERYVTAAGSMRRPSGRNCMRFLKEELKLELSMEKTRVTHVSEGFVFLGYLIDRSVGRIRKMGSTEFAFQRGPWRKVRRKIRGRPEPGYP